MSGQFDKRFPISRGLWLLSFNGDGAELQNLETGVSIEVQPDTRSGCYSLCRFASSERNDDECGCEVAGGLSKEGAFRLISQFAERVGSLDLKDFQETH